MGSIYLTELGASNPHVTIDDLSPRTTRENSHVFKDIQLDLTFSHILGNVPADKSIDSTDVNDIRDIRAIVQSVNNIMSTTPGEKLLNPYLGLDLTKYIFEPVTKQTGDLIARSILKGLGEQEPRVRINHMTVVADVSQHQYNIQFILEFPAVNQEEIALNGVLNRGGFKILE